MVDLRFELNWKLKLFIFQALVVLAGRLVPQDHSKDNILRKQEN